MARVTSRASCILMRKLVCRVTKSRLHIRYFERSDRARSREQKPAYPRHNCFRARERSRWILDEILSENPQEKLTPPPDPRVTMMKCPPHPEE